MASLRVWSTFVRRNKQALMKFRVQDLPQYLIDDASDFYMKYFVKEETLQKASGVPTNPEAMKEAREIISKMLRDPSHRTLICCSDSEENAVQTIIAAYCVQTTNFDISVKEMQDHVTELKTKEMRKFFEILLGMDSMYDSTKIFGTRKYYDYKGGAVHPDYRTLGVATEVLKVIRYMGQECGVPLVAAWMTSPGTQKGAARIGWETVFEVCPAELDRRFGVTFEDAPHTFKLMIDRAKSN